MPTNEAGDGLGRFPSEVLDRSPPAELFGSEDKQQATIAQLSELLEWERRARAEAQERLTELEAELIRVKLDAASEQKRLKMELAAAEAAATSSAERDMKDVVARFTAELDDARARISELEGALAKAEAALEVEQSQARAVEKSAADAALQRRRAGGGRRRRHGQQRRRPSDAVAPLRAPAVRRRS